MQLAIAEAEAQLEDLVRRAEAGEEVVLTREGVPAVRLVCARPRPTKEERERVLDEVLAMVAKLPPSPGPDAARSQDFLYDEHGLPA